MEQIMYYYWGVFFTLIGLVVGSFLNVCIYRMPKGETVVTVPSHCMKCGHNLAWYDLFPVFSYIFLGGKCRYCKEKISPRYMLVELLNCVLWAFTYFYFDGFSHNTIITALLFSSLIIITFTDIDTQEVPDRINLFIGILGLVNIFFNLDNWHSYIIGFFAVSIPVFILALITNGFGMGDIKLFAALGLLMGWGNVILCFAFSVVLGGIISCVLLLTKKVSGKTCISFVPFIAVSAVVCQLIGNDIINWYVSMFIK